MTPMKWSAARAAFLALLAAVSAFCQDESREVSFRQESRLEHNRILPSQLLVTLTAARGRLKAGDPRIAECERTEFETMQLLKAGRTGEARQLMYRMLAILTDRQWTDRDTFLSLSVTAMPMQLRPCPPRALWLPT